MTEQYTNVVALPGVAGCQPPSTANEAVVGCLRQLLAEAERGEIVGIAFAGVRPGRAGITTGWEPGSASAVDMLAAANGVAARINLVWVQSL